MLHRLAGLVLGFVCALTATAQSNWTVQHQGAPSSAFLWSIAEGPAGIVAVGTQGTLLHSFDGRTWTHRTSGTTEWLVAVTYGAGRYIVVGDNGLILTSSDAITWTSVVSGTTRRLNNVLYADSRFVAVGEAGTILTSADAISWRAVTLAAPFDGWLRGLAWGRAGQTARWLVTGQAGEMLTSSDALKWDGVGVLDFGRAAPDFEAAVFTGAGNFAGIDSAQFVAAGGSGNVATVDIGLLNLAKPAAGPFTHNLPTTGRLRSVTIANGVLLATGESGAIITAPRPGGPWRLAPVATTKNLVGAAFIQGCLVLVGEDETIVQSDPVFLGRLGNLSTRGIASNVANAIISGTVVQGTRPKQILFRGAGPSLEQFGVPYVLDNQVLTVFDATNRPIASNAGWDQGADAAAIAAAAKSVGAFPFRAGSSDTALLLTLEPGNYTFQVASTIGNSGNALLEAYDLDRLDGTASRAINISTRGMVGLSGIGDGFLTAGFVVQGPASRTLLIRGVGPTLLQLGVPTALPQPQLRVLSQDGTVITTADNWSAAPEAVQRLVTSAAVACGAFPLAAGSSDAALVISLLPGNYTVQLGSATAATGVALVEVYDVPNSSDYAPDTPVDLAFNLEPLLSTPPVTAAEQLDGRILLGGSFSFATAAGQRRALVRVNRNGALDSTFTVATIDAPGEVRSIAIQPSGKIVIGGTFVSVNGTTISHLARLNADGTLDPSFTPPGTLAEVTQVAVDSGGRIFVNTGSSVARLLANGTPDPFWTGGSYTFLYGPGTQVSPMGAALKRISLAPNGTVAALGSVSLPGFLTPPLAPRAGDFVFSFTSAGSLDDTARNAWSNSLGSPKFDLRILADGSIVTCGATTTVAATVGAVAADGSSWLGGAFTAPQIHLVHLNRDGTVGPFRLTTGFTTGNGTAAPPSCLVPLNDGGVLAMGSFARVDGTLRPTVVRLKSR